MIMSSGCEEDNGGQVEDEGESRQVMRTRRQVRG